MDLLSLIAAYGYPVVFAGALIEGETVLVLAGVAAHLGYLSLAKVAAVATLIALVLYRRRRRRAAQASSDVRAGTVR